MDLTAPQPLASSNSQDLKERLRHAEARNRYLESLLENQQNVYVMRAGFDQTYTYANRSFCQAFDLPGQAMVGRSLFSTMIPEDIPAVQAAGMAAIINPGQMFPVRIHKTIPGKPDQIVITDWELVAVTDADGRVLEVQGMGVDVTEKERFLRDLTRYKTRLEQILESLPNGFFAMDRQGTITFVNELMARTLERTATEIVGLHFFDLLPDDHRQHCQAMLEQVLANQETVKFEAHWPEQGRWLSITAYPTPEGLAAFWRDVTAQRRSEQQVDKQQATLRNIAWVQSHQVRAPLAHILGLIKILTHTDPSDPSCGQLLHMLDEAGRNLDAIIHEVVEKSYEPEM